MLIDLLQLATLLTNFYTIQTGLYEPALYHKASNLNIDYRLSLLSITLSNTKFILALASEPTSLARNSPLVYWVHYGFGVLMAYKLSHLQTDGWDLLLARQELDLNNNLQRQIARIESSVISAVEPDILAKFAKQLERIKTQLFNSEAHGHLVSFFLVQLIRGI